MSRIGVVVIGRNEGERLGRCLRSVAGRAPTILYVDSGSSDDSVRVARELGVTVIELDTSIPFTAARARNEGFAGLMQLAPDIDYVQFIDGDCEVIDGWLHDAAARLDQHADIAVVCGRLRERHPEATIYNRLCDMEWNGPAGEVGACGGIAMMRATAFAQAGGFNSAVIAAEDDELCVRLRQRGGRIWRLDRDMAWHDAAMTRFSQWWRRATRAGHAFAQVNAIHGTAPMHYFRREVRSAWLWGLVFPGIIIGALVIGWWWAALAIASLYILQAVRIAWRTRRRGYSAAQACLYAANCVVAKLPHVLGISRYWWNRLRRRPASIIEHKRPVTAKQGEPGIENG